MITPAPRPPVRFHMCPATTENVLLCPLLYLPVTPGMNVASSGAFALLKLCGLQPIWKCAVANNDWYSLFVCVPCPCKLNMSGCYRLVSERGEGGTALRCFRDTARDVQPGHWRTASTAATAGPLMWTPASSNLWFTYSEGNKPQVFPEYWISGIPWVGESQ